MKTILVPTDFSDYAKNALNVAKQIAKATNSEIILLHIIPAPNPLLISGSKQEIKDLQHQFLQEAKDSSQEALKKQVSETDAVKTRLLTRVGSIFANINEIVKEEEIDLVVMGTHGVTGMKEIFVGSNTEKVVRTAVCPVLTVHEDKSEFNPQKIIFATDFHQKHAISYDKLRKFANIFDAHIYVLYLNTPSTFINTREMNKRYQKFMTYVEEVGKHSLEVCAGFSVEMGILDFGEDVEADLIALPTSQRKGLAHFFAGSTAEDVVNHSKVPVLTLGKF